MPRKKYTAEFKTKIILSILQGDKEWIGYNKLDSFFKELLK